MVRALALAGLALAAPPMALCASEVLVSNVTGLYSVKVARVTTPRTTADVARAVSSWLGKIAVGGGRYSMGGQIAIEGGLHMDMRDMKSLVWIDVNRKLVRVQAGMRWRELQDILDVHGLAVHTMQSYANFTVGGSVSVNAHGRYVVHGPVCNSVMALQLVLADGSVIEASRSRNFELFRAAIGGYGAIAVITEVELALADNIRIERSVKEVSLREYPAFHETHVKAEKSCILHNADLAPPFFDKPVTVTWRSTDKPLTETARLIPRNKDYNQEKNVLWAMTEIPGGEHLRQSVVDPLLFSAPQVTWLNHEASKDVAELEPRTRAISTYALQEYFIPVRHFLPFVRALARVLREHEVEALNVSIRHSPADTVSLLPWAREEVFTFVLYYKQRTHRHARNEVGDWTRKLIELALTHEGRYYLPYQPHATRKQFRRAYPESTTLQTLKQKVDPTDKFSNALWSRYL